MENFDRQDILDKAARAYDHAEKTIMAMEGSVNRRSFPYVK